MYAYGGLKCQLEMHPFTGRCEKLSVDWLRDDASVMLGDEDVVDDDLHRRSTIEPATVGASADNREGTFVYKLISIWISSWHPCWRLVFRWISRRTRG